MAMTARLHGNGLLLDITPKDHIVASSAVKLAPTYVMDFMSQDNPDYQALIDSGDITFQLCRYCNKSTPIYHSTGEPTECSGCSRINHASKIGWTRTMNDKLVFTNGCFDLIHPGHIALFEFCRQLTKSIGGEIMVGLNGDDSFKLVKGREPIFSLMDRTAMLMSLRQVDWVKFFDEPTPLRLICEVKPMFIVKGGDYKEEDVVGYNECKDWGGQVVLCPYDSQYSTTNIRRRISDARQGMWS